MNFTQEISPRNIPGPLHRDGLADAPLHDRRLEPAKWALRVEVHNLVLTWRRPIVLQLTGRRGRAGGQAGRGHPGQELCRKEISRGTENH